MLWTSIGLIVLALALLYAGAEALVRGCASLAIRLGVTPLMVGLTVVAYGTSTPELLVSTKAAVAGQGDISIGNVVGSNIFNICVILGLSSLICPMKVKVQLVRIDSPLCLVASVLAWLVLRDGYLSRLEGMFFLAIIVPYTITNAFLARRETKPDVLHEFNAGISPKSKHVFVDFLLIFGGFGILVVGSRLLVDHAISVARFVGVNEAVIGLTIVAAGTSVPELATSIVAAIRREADIAIGNVIGSNIYNILAILGCSALLAPIRASSISMFDLILMTATAVLLQFLLWTNLRLVRIEGALLILVYVGYLWWLWPK